MVKFFVKPSRSASARSMRTHMEWKVDTHMPRERVPTSCAKRSRISAAALLVKVMARISHGAARSCSRMLAMRYVSTRVLPEPAPASTRSGPWVVTTASRWGPFKVSMSMGTVRPLPSSRFRCPARPARSARAVRRSAISRESQQLHCRRRHEKSRPIERLDYSSLPAHFWNHRSRRFHGLAEK